MDSLNRLGAYLGKSFAEFDAMFASAHKDTTALEETIASNASMIAGQANRIKELEILVSQLRNQKDLAIAASKAEKQFNEQEQTEKKKLLEEISQLRAKLAESEQALEQYHPTRLRKQAEERKARAAKLLEEAEKLEQEAGKE